MKNKIPRPIIKTGINVKYCNFLITVCDCITYPFQNIFYYKIFVILLKECYIIVKSVVLLSNFDIIIFVNIL
jgi:hypothetical protein